MIRAPRLPGRPLRRTALAGLTTALLLLGGVATSTTQAATAPGHAPARTTSVSRAGGRISGCNPRAVHAKVVTAMARLGRAPDQPSYSPRRLRRLDRRLHRRLAAVGVSHPDARFGLVLRIPVAVHVIAGTHDRGPSLFRVRREIRVINNAYDGGESAHNAPTRFSFQMVSFDRTVNQRWHVASLGDRAGRIARRNLHVGGTNELNLYISAPSTGTRRGGVVLGWSSMPWRAQSHLPEDGVTVNEGSLAGGGLRHYDQGDTAVHEIGHWLGLFHTFQGGCSKLNDHVADTPAEAYPSTTCHVGRDTCPAPGLDPVHNFMDYSYDSCMDRFTPGQVNRMTDNWLAYRTP